MKKIFADNAHNLAHVLAIPVVDLNIATNFPKLCNRLFKNHGFEDAYLREVHQHVAFRMDEAGAIVRSTAYAAAGWGASSKPRRFIFDRPFLLALWKKDARLPYLAAWIAAPDVLVPFKKSP